MSAASGPDPSGIMTIGEVADYRKVTERTIYRLAVFEGGYQDMGLKERSKPN
jgi:hypothetical protein